MRPEEVRRLVASTTLRLEESREELRDLDAALGDGDLGITVSAGAAAVRAAVQSLPDDASVADVLKASARAFGSANPATMSALVSMALLAAARELADVTLVDRDAAVALVGAAAASISSRGKAEPGDKTVLDALVPSAQALQGAPAGHEAGLDAMIAAAAAGVESTTALQSRRGRAAWVAERSMGHADGGAVAYLRLLEAMRAGWPVDARPVTHGSTEEHTC